MKNEYLLKIINEIVYINLKLGQLTLHSNGNDIHDRDSPLFSLFPFVRWYADH